MEIPSSDNGIAPYTETKAQRRLFDVYAETKSVKDVSYNLSW